MTPTKTKTKAQIRVSPLYSSPLNTADGRILPTEGAKVCRWIEQNGRYGEGDWFGKRVRLREFQRRFLHRLYEFYPETGRRRYRRAILGMGKGGGKTSLGALIAAYELAGGTHVSPRVIIGAASLKQANWVFGDLRTCVSESPTLKPLVEAFDLQILLRDRPGVAERIAAETGTNDGARCTCFIPDELHEWTMGKKRVFLIVDGAVAKRRDAFTVGFTTAGVKGQDSPAEDLYEYGKKVAAGIITDDAFLFEWYEAPEGLDPDDPDQWLEGTMAANPGLGDLPDLDSLRYRFETLPRHEFERYHWNRWVSSVNRWIPLEDWDACAGEVEIADGDVAFLGIDGAAKRDTTALVLVVPKEEKLHVRCWIFEPPGDGGVIDPALVEEQVREICHTYDIQRVVFDPALFFRSAQLLLEEGYPMEEFPQSHARMCPASQALYDAVMQHRLVHDGDPVLRAHADSAVARDTGRGWRLDKVKETEHMDAMVALAMAVQTAEEDQGSDSGVLFLDD